MGAPADGPASPAEFVAEHQSELAKLVPHALSPSQGSKAGFVKAGAEQLAGALGGPLAGSLAKVAAEALFGDNKATRVFRDGLEECEQEERERRTLERISQVVGDALAELNDNQTIQLVRVGHAIKVELKQDLARLEAKIDGLPEALGRGVPAQPQQPPPIPFEADG